MQHKLLRPLLNLTLVLALLFVVAAELLVRCERVRTLLPAPAGECYTNR